MKKRRRKRRGKEGKRKRKKRRNFFDLENGISMVVAPCSMIESRKKWV